MADTVMEWSDVLTRPLLLTVTASRVARAVVLYQLSRNPAAWATPDELASYIAKQLGWAPSEDTLYNAILATLRGKERVPKGNPGSSRVPGRTAGQEPVVDVKIIKGGENHRWTSYRINSSGLTLLEEERSKLVGHGAPLSAALHGLQHLARVIGTQEPPVEKTVTNLNVLLRWLVLRTLIDLGPSSISTIATYAYGCAGQISYLPQGSALMEKWPREEVVRRAVAELQSEDHRLFGVRKAGSIVSLTETGVVLEERWRPHLSQAVARGIEFAKGAIAVLE